MPYEVEAKGYLGGIRILVADSAIEFAAYDTFRLAQDIAYEIRERGFFPHSNLLVVETVTRENIEAAVERLAISGFTDFSKLHS